MPIYPEKTLLYGLCDLLINKKLTPAATGRDALVTLNLQSILREIGLNPIDQLAISELETEITRLSNENNNERTSKLIKITNPNILKTFKQNVTTNKSINLDYRREDLEKYKDYLLRGDNRRQQGDNFSQLRFVAELGNYRFEYQGMVLPIKENGTRSLRLNLCLLMYGHRCNLIPTGPRSRLLKAPKLDDYAIGDDVQISLISEIIFKEMNNEAEHAGPLHDEFRPLRDAVTQMNKRAKNLFNTMIFTYGNQRIKVVHTYP